MILLRQPIQTTNMKRGSGAGLINLGETCYMNSALQVIFHLPPFQEFLSSDEHPSCQGGVEKTCLICILKKMYKKSRNFGQFAPEEIWLKLKEISNTFTFDRQEDSHEYFVKLVERLEEWWAQFLVPGQVIAPSPFNRLLEGSLRHEIGCHGCGVVTGRAEAFKFLNCSLSGKKTSNIQDILVNHFSRTFFEGKNLYDCRECYEKSPATQQTRISEQRKILCLQLKRFRGLQKNFQNIILEQTLDATPHTPLPTDIRRKDNV